MMKKVSLVSCFWLLMFNCGMVLAESVPVIAAATDLKFVLEKISQNFTEQTGKKVKFVFGSSGKFFQQINAQEGAFELFMSSDEKYVLDLAEKGLTLDKGTLYGMGRLVLFAPTGSKLKVDDELTGLAGALQNGRLKRFAISDPDHAPYGRAAKQALLAKGLWEKIKPKLLLGETTMQTAQLVSAGAAQGAIFAYSLVFDPKIRGKGKFALLPDSLHDPIRHRMALLKNASPTAQAFYDYLQSSPARMVFSEYNFSFVLFRQVEKN
jgi:molybdate transport system substrate-binding protein